MKLLLAVILLFGLTPALAQSPVSGPSTDNLSWMAGCWELTARNGAMVISEQWMKPGGGTLIGMSRTVNGDKTDSWEFLRIVADAKGLSYIAKPNTNKEETVFKLAKSSATELIFENPANDFPQRIIYRNAGPDSLFARIEGTNNGKLSGMDIPMKRVRCEP